MLSVEGIWPCVTAGCPVLFGCGHTVVDFPMYIRPHDWHREINSKFGQWPVAYRKFLLLLVRVTKPVVKEQQYSPNILHLLDVPEKFNNNLSSLTSLCTSSTAWPWSTRGTWVSLFEKRTGSCQRNDILVGLWMKGWDIILSFCGIRCLYMWKIIPRYFFPTLSGIPVIVVSSRTEIGGWMTAMMSFNSYSLIKTTEQHCRRRGRWFHVSLSMIGNVRIFNTLLVHGVYCSYRQY